MFMSKQGSDSTKQAIGRSALPNTRGRMPVIRSSSVLAAVCLSCLGQMGCGTSSTDLLSAQNPIKTGSIQYLSTSDTSVEMVALKAIIGPPVTVNQLMAKQLVSQSGKQSGIVIFQNSTTALPHSLQIELQAEQVKNRVHVYYRSDVLDAKGQLVKRLNGEEVAEITNLGAGSARASGKVVIVKRGDTLSSLSRRHSVSVADLMKYNNLKNTMIRPDQKLRIQSSGPKGGNAWEYVTPAQTLAIARKVVNTLSATVRAGKQKSPG
jgi:LysM repeat protein